MKSLSRPPKICILTSVHPIFDTRIFHKEAKTLKNAGYDITLIAQHNKREIIDGITIIPLPTPRNRLERTTKLTGKLLLLALKEKADIYHFHDPELILVGVVLKLLSKKVIYDVHEDVPKSMLSRDWLPKPIRKPISFLFNLFEKKISTGFDYIITATPSIANNFKIHNVIHIGNYPFVYLEPQTLKKRNHFNNKKYTVIYIGGLDKNRGIKEIIQAVELVNLEYSIKLLLIGKFSDGNFEEECRNLIGWNKTEFIEWLPYKKLIPYLLNANAGLVCFHPEPNHIEALPNKLFEYMTAGLPVIASNFLLWQEIIRENNCGIYVNPLKPSEIAKAIEHLIENPKEAKKMGENGKKTVLEKYNWKNESKKLLALYKELCENTF